MYYQGKFSPKNYKKYKGDPTNIIYRSSWELTFMKYCDSNPNVLEWGSEEIVIPYKSPLDNRYHRYFVDFYIKVKEKTGVVKKYLIVGHRGWLRSVPIRSFYGRGMPLLTSRIQPLPYLEQIIPKLKCCSVRFIPTSPHRFLLSVPEKP